jgi:hypothetical protein
MGLRSGLLALVAVIAAVQGAPIAEAAGWSVQPSPNPHGGWLVDERALRRTRLEPVVGALGRKAMVDQSDAQSSPYRSDGIA